MMIYIYIYNLFFLSFFFLELCSDKAGWYKENYAKTFDVSLSSVKDNVERVDASRVSYQEFVEKYEKSYTPVVVTHAQDGWNAETKWTLEVRGFSQIKLM